MSDRYRYLSILFGLAVFLTAFAGCSKEPTEQEILDKAIEHQRWDEADDALTNFKMLLDRFPKSSNVPEALYAMGLIYEKNKRDFPKAAATFKRLADEYPDHATASSAVYHWALILRRDMNMPDSARAVFGLLLKRYPSSAVTLSAKAELDSLNALMRKKSR